MPKLRFGILLLKLRARIIISCALTLRNLECGGRVTKFGVKVANVSCGLVAHSSTIGQQHVVDERQATTSAFKYCKHAKTAGG